MVTDGSVTVAGAPSGSADLAAGASGAFDGALTVVNGGTVPAALSSDDLPLQGDGDHDADDLSFDQERDLGTDPANPDTDGDGDDDGYEVNNGTDPLVRNDGQPDPSTVDSDGDGFSDQDEIDAGSDPNDSDSTP